MRSPSAVGLNIGGGLAMGIGSFFISLADGLIPSNPAPKPKQAEPEPRRGLFDLAAEDARQRSRREEELEDRRLEEERWARSQQ